MKHVLILNGGSFTTDSGLSISNNTGREIVATTFGTDVVTIHNDTQYVSGPRTPIPRNFGWALAQSRKGVEVRRLAWPDHWVETGEMEGLESKDLLAEDWVRV